LAGLGDLYSEVDEFEAASQAYQQAIEISGNLAMDFITTYLVVAQGNLALARKDMEEANNILKRFRKRIRTSQSVYERGLLALLEGRYYLLKGEPRKAVARLNDCKELFAQDGRDLELMWSVIWLASAYQLSGEQNDARTELQGILVSGLPPDHALLVTLRQAIPWLEELQKDLSIGRQLGNLIEKSQQLNSKLPAIRRALRRQASFIQVPSAMIMIRAFGNPEVSVNGRVIQMSEWRTQSVRDLFLYFLHTQDAVTKEQVGAALWPETRDTQALKARFKNEIYRLRRAVGRDVIVFEEEYYRFNRQMDFDYDVDAFASHSLRALKALDRNFRLNHLQEAVNLVHGD
jgi:tetratricopeptide (TPR) repeat protein